MWADDLSAVSLTDAVEAARMYYRETPGKAWLVPGDVIANVKRIREKHEREDRIQRQLAPAPDPTFSDEGVKHYWAEVARLKAEKAKNE
ncbi:hypothetical protein [Microbacterium jejuense]|uniref:hypothetical protein n=1 Tax=Microbacterium jejuense TaxID=1263637 RepID=UPI0031F0A29B